MKACARSYLWWPGIDKEIESCVAQCDTCQQHQKAIPKGSSPTWERPSTPWDTLHVDLAGPVDGKVFLVIVDAFTKWLEVRAISSMTSASVICELRNVFATFGVPRKVVSDNGSAFVSNEIKTFYRLNGVLPVTSAPYHPATNGQAERMVQQLKQALAKRGREEFKCFLPRFLYKQHITVHTATGKTPAWMMFGRELPSPLERLIRVPKDEVQATTENPCQYVVGQSVWVLKFPSGRTWMSGVITERLGSRSWIIQTEDGLVRRHMDHIRPRLLAARRSSDTPSAAWGLDVQAEEAPADAISAEGNELSEPVAMPIRAGTRERRPPTRYGITAK